MAEKRDEVLATRVSEIEARKILELAARQGFSVSDFIRFHLVRAVSIEARSARQESLSPVDSAP
jgi:hypothetical protein